MHPAVERLRAAAIATATAAATAFCAFPSQAATPIPRGPATTAVKPVGYQGYVLRVPKSWTVVDLSRTPRTCVRFDRHTLYLGRPDVDQDCPGGVVGRTEALLVQPAVNGPAARGAAADDEAHEVDVNAARVDVTATYGSDRALVLRILDDAGLATAASAQPRAATARGLSFAGPLPGSSGPWTALPDATNFTGEGFDACSAPSTATMRAWTGTSPYGAVGIYIGGSERACSQPDLTAPWVRDQYDAGWRFMPIYAGEQAPSISSPMTEGARAAADAVAQACRLGFGPGATLYYDMEAYTPRYSTRVLAFETAWTRELHAEGYYSGYYSSSHSGIDDLVRNYGSDAYAMPDVIYDGLWNGSADTNDSTVPVDDWSDHQRAHQYSGSVHETWGGVRRAVDHDFLDVRLPEWRVPPGNVPGPASTRDAGPGPHVTSGVTHAPA